MYADGPVSVCTHYIGKLCVWWGDGVYFSLIAKTANGAYLGSWSQTFSIPFSAKFASRECVIEGPWNYDFDPKHPERGLPNFGTITFQDCELLNNLNNSVDVDEIYNPATGHVLARVTGVYGIEPHTYIDIRWMAAR